MSDDTDSEATGFMGPPGVPWWKFKLAGIVWKLTRGNPISAVGYIPGTHRAAMWAFKVRVLSRDFEITDRE